MLVRFFSLSKRCFFLSEWDADNDPRDALSKPHGKKQTWSQYLQIITELTSNQLVTII